MDNFFDLFFFGMPGSGKNNITENYKINKKWAGINIFYHLLSLVLGRFEYDLPETMDSRFFEMMLICNGINGTAIGKDGLLSNFKVGYGNKFSKYGYYNNVNLMDFMGLSQGMFIPDCPGNVMPDCVLTYDNKYNIPPISRIMWYATQLTRLQGSMNACIANLKGATILTCTKEQGPAVKRAWEKADEGSPVIISFAPNEGAADLRPEIIANPQTGDVLKTLVETYDKVMSDFLTEFGINANGIINKLSGVSDTELKQNDQARQIVLYNALKSRQKGIEQINKMFGTNASVKIVEPLEEKKPEPLDNEKEEGTDDENDI